MLTQNYRKSDLIIQSEATSFYEFEKYLPCLLLTRKVKNFSSPSNNHKQ